MYHQFYGLREKPFSLSPDPRFLYLADSHREALAHLLYGIEEGAGFIAITGEVGTGKTTLCRTLLQRIEPGTEVAFIFNPQLSASELLQSICAELGLPTRAPSQRELTDELNRFLLAKKSEGRRVILLIDEAQNLPPDTLEQVRLLSNLETDTEKLLQIVLLGQPELDALLESPSLRQLRQRISVRWRLAPLTTLETRDYVRHRLRIAAGGPREVFTELALREIHRRSGGIPRVVNLLCDRALLAGFGASSPTIGLGLVNQAEREVRGGARELATPPPPRLLDRVLPEPMKQVLAAAALVALGVAATVLIQRLVLAPGAPPPALPQVVPAPPALPPVAAAPPPAAAPGLPVGPGAALEVRPAQAGAEPPARDLRRPAPEAEPAALDMRRPPPEAPPAAAVSEAEPAPEPAPAVALAPAPTDAERVDLGLALARSSPAATAASSVARMVSLWKGDGYRGPGYISQEEALDLLASSEISVVALTDVDLQALLFFNYPALLELRAVDGAPRTVLLTSLEGDDATLVGLDGERAHRVRSEELREAWTGAAWIGWRDFAELPDVLRPGQQGSSVAWLQRSLHELGFLASEVPSGVYDLETAEAVRAFQESRDLEVDGTVGPYTKMSLYESLADYAIPRLVPRSAAPQSVATQGVG